MVIKRNSLIIEKYSLTNKKKLNTHILSIIKLYIFKIISYVLQHSFNNIY